jgi:hypothetical protein
MSLTTRRVLRATSAFAVLAGVAIGCGKPENSPTPPAPSDDAKANPGGPNPKPNPGHPLAGLGKTPSNEDPAVTAFLNQKGWKLYTDMRISDGKRLVYLTVEAKDKPFEKVAVTPDDYKMIAKSKTLQVLDLRNVECTDEGLKAIEGIPQMEGILVNGEAVGDAGMKALAQAKGLENIALFGTKKVTDAGIKELASLPKLQTLYVAFTTLDGSGFEPFAGSKTLTSLTLDYIDGLTDDGAKHIGKIPNLNELKIGSGFGEKKLTAAGIRAIVESRLPAKFEFDKKLIDDDLLAALLAKKWFPTGTGSGQKAPATPEEVRYITLDDSKVTDKGFAPLLNCTNVTSLHMRKTGITDETLTKLGAFKKLDYLSLEKTKIGAPGLEAVAGLPIKHLALEGCELTEDMFKAFGKMTTLEELWLSDAKMKAEWLKHIATLPKLRELNLLHADFDDAAVPSVVSLPSLTSLTLNRTNLGDPGFQELVKLPKLKSLYVDGTKVTKPVYQKAKKEHPKLTLFFYSYDQ